MRISSQQFERELKSPRSRKFNIVFMGMSGSGKTHWSKLFSQQYSYVHVEFDDLIGGSDELAELIKNVPGKDAAERMGNYFGMPWSDDYAAKERRFLDVEGIFMSHKYPNGSVLDLTGSCIYHKERMDVLCSNGLVIYLETSPEKEREMFETFKLSPKPVIWSGVFKREEHESNDEAIERCYMLLLRQRAVLYATYADVILPYDDHKNVQSVEDFVERIKGQLSE